MADDKFEFLDVEFTAEEAQALLKTVGYTKFELECGRGPSGFSEFKLCCNHPDTGRRMFAEHAWNHERRAMIKRLLLAGLDKKALP